MNDTETRTAVVGPLDQAVRPVGWLREQRGEFEGRQTMDPLFVLGEPTPRHFFNGATYEALYDKAAFDAAVAAERERLRALIADDASAMTYQTMGQYRSSLMKALRPNTEAQRTA